MLDNEPTSGAKSTHETQNTTGEDHITENGSAAPERRKPAVRPAGPPPEPPAPAPVRTATTTAPASDSDAAAEPSTDDTESSDPPATTKKSTRSTKATKSTKAASTGSKTKTETKAPAKSRSKTRAAAEPDTAADAASAESEPATETPGSGEPAAAEPGPQPDGSAEAPETVASQNVAPSAPASRSAATVAFQPPQLVFQPPTEQEPASRNGVRAEQDTETEAEIDEDEDTDGEDEGSRPARRRRRRGGRGRGRTRAAEGEDGAESGESEESSTDTSDATDTAEASESAAKDDTADDGGENGSRRRRRRRRRGSSAEAGDGEENRSDDPPNTVVRVREPRATSGDAEVQGVKGSTRLEAKKQRRREGREQGRRRPPIVTESEFLARRESVKRDLIVRRAGERTQIAVLEDDVLVEHYVDRSSHKSLVGSVYLGRVQNVLPSMEAAFVDIGKGRNAVLYAGEVNWDATGLEGQPKRIESALKSGQSVLVQVTKDPVGHKGARLTSQISLPGRYLVYVPDGSMTGISRKLPDKERARLKQILKQVMPEDAGVIVRTAAEGASEEELQRDITRLAAQWKSISKKAKSATAPKLLSSEPDLTVRVVRDVFNEDFASLVVSGEEAWNTVEEYVNYVAPNLAERLTHHQGETDVFEDYRIDEQIAKALDRKVWLPSGGSLVIDRTEAMTVIDVNTGKFTGQGGNLEETVTKNNLEAAEEIVRQLRLRDIGGIIVVDFIDMVLESNRDLVLRRMLECLSRDRTKHQVAEVTSLGLVQMTRKRVGQGLLEAFSQTCDCCNGRGLIVSPDAPEAKQSGSGAQAGGKKKKGKAQKSAKSEGDSGGEAAQEQTPAEASAKGQKAGKSAGGEKEKRSNSGSSRAKAAASDAAPAESDEPAASSDDAGGDAADGAESDGDKAERPKRRRTRRTKTSSSGSTTAVAEAT
ncbi:Rne/Rng family ribonuclease [Spiractinospora alimapuensis]|uniref:Rne/Rng family ribonuclease n=1 Tax=Spiractinospora alimapuensis TaxID=2820884 RepID=UPI001F182CE4|nr:Rne/Rng family ribonuclease [Spiractinospora alimapuensis]QVQ51936.1 Rne/Rng family ribonuclease [Spiractinospora alimapuensis]